MSPFEFATAPLVLATILGTQLEASPMDLQIDRDELVELTRRLIQFRSINPPGDVREITDDIEQLLTGWGLAPRRITRDPLKPNLMVTLGPEGYAWDW